MVKQGPRPLVICGPSGSGKSTLLKKLRTELPDTFALCVSHTTRKPRPGECDGVDYHYVTVEQMQAAIARGDFLETATFSGNMYGTRCVLTLSISISLIIFEPNQRIIYALTFSKQSVRNVQALGKVCVLDIEIEGVKQIAATDLNPLKVFILPPSIVELENRLRGRNTETEESLQKRLNTAKSEIDFGKCKPVKLLSYHT